MADAYAKSRGGGLSGTFWSAIDEGRFCVQRCRDCGTYRFPPIAMCPSCHSINDEWVQVSGDATVWTWTIAHRAPKPQFTEMVPYCLVVAQLAEGPLVLGRLGAGRTGPEPPQIGAPLRLVVTDPAEAPDGRARYRFELADPTGG